MKHPGGGPQSVTAVQCMTLGLPLLPPFHGQTQGLFSSPLSSGRPTMVLLLRWIHVGVATAKNGGAVVRSHWTFSVVPCDID